MKTQQQISQRNKAFHTKMDELRKESARGKEMKKCDCGCGQDMSPGNQDYIAGHRPKNMAQLADCMKLPAKRWTICHVCLGDVPLFSGEHSSNRGICREAHSPECHEKVNKMALEKRLKRWEESKTYRPCEECKQDVLMGPRQQYCPKCARERNKKYHKTYVRLLVKSREFDRGECCQRLDDLGHIVLCKNYIDALYHEFKKCPRHECFVVR